MRRLHFWASSILSKMNEMTKSVIFRALIMSGGGDLQCHARARMCRVNFLRHIASTRQMNTDGSTEKSNAINWSSYPPWIAIGISAIGVYLSLIGVNLHSASELRNEMSKDKAELKADMSNHLTKLETKLDRHLESNSNLQGKSELLEKVILKKARWWWW